MHGKLFATVHCVLDLKNEKNLETGFFHCKILELQNALY